MEDVTNRIVDHIRPGPDRLDWDSLMTTMDIMETFDEVKIWFRFLREMCIDAYVNSTTAEQWSQQIPTYFCMHMRYCTYMQWVTSDEGFWLHSPILKLKVHLSISAENKE